MTDVSASEATEDDDPFADIKDEPEADPLALRTQLLSRTLRRFTPMRKTFVQRPKEEAHRGAVLADLVSHRKHRELKLLLALHALNPILGEPFPLKTWANFVRGPLLSCTAIQASDAFSVLAGRGLVERSEKGVRPFVVVPRLEDGSGEPFIQAGRPGACIGPGYFTIPDELWTTGLVDKLGLPGMAMFLIILAETTRDTTFEMAVEKAQRYYAISERTAERGYHQLDQAGVLRVRGQIINDPRSTTGRRTIYHRALHAPYSTAARDQRQKETRKATRARTQGTSAEVAQ